MTTYQVTLPKCEPLVVLASSRISAILMTRDHYGWPTNKSVVGVKIKEMK